MKPKAVVSGFIAGVDLGGLIAALRRHRCSCPIKQTEQPVHVTSGDLVKANLVEMRDMKRDNPLRLAQLNCRKDFFATESVILLNGSIHGALLMQVFRTSKMPEDRAQPHGISDLRCRSYSG